MSKIGKQLITIPEDVTVNIAGSQIEVTGPKGSLKHTLLPGIAVTQTVDHSHLQFTRENDQNQTKAVHGLTRSLVNNLVKGVTSGWQKRLELVGTGYRASLQGTSLSLSIGYSHPIVFAAPPGITFQLDGQTKIAVEGIDKHLVGQIAADVRAARPPEPYKGKGIRYVDEKIRRKPGKSATATAG